MISIYSIFAAVSEVSGIPVDAIRGQRRTRGVVMARFAVVYLIRDLFPLWGYADIASAIDRADHGTAAHALRRSRQLMRDDTDFHNLIVTVLHSIQTPPPPSS